MYTSSTGVNQCVVPYYEHNAPSSHPPVHHPFYKRAKHTFSIALLALHSAPPHPHQQNRQYTRASTQGDDTFCQEAEARRQGGGHSTDRRRQNQYTERETFVRYVIFPAKHLFCILRSFVECTTSQVGNVGRSRWRRKPDRYRIDLQHAHISAERPIRRGPRESNRH